MSKYSNLIHIVDRYILENFKDINRESSNIYGYWKNIAVIISENNKLESVISNDYISVRYRKILSALKNGKTVEELLNKIINPISKKEKRKIYNERYKKSEKGIATKERMSKNPWHIRNREYRKQKDREYRKNNPQKEKDRSRRNQIRLYGITEEIYNSMLEKQNSRCAICYIHQSEFKKSFHIDHCHETGKVRGLLCRNCNIGLGHFKDSVTLLNNTIKYLTKNEG